MDQTSQARQEQPEEPVETGTDTQQEHASPEEGTEAEVHHHSQEEEAPQAAAPAGDEELARMKDQLMRALAEVENTRRRARKDVEEASQYAITGFARDMISVVENLSRALQNIPEGARAENEQLKLLGEGVDMTMRELLAIFERHGIRRIDPMGEKFDHNLHQAVAQVEDNNQPPGTVVQVLQAGYVIQGRLLRPAMVTVSKGNSQAAPVDTKA